MGRFPDGGAAVIVRTAPTTIPGPDAMRAMERLEAQLRRAADDLAESLVAMREGQRLQAEAEVQQALAAIAGPVEGGRPRCARWMPRVGQPCGRFAGHRDSCRSRALMDEEAARRARRRA